MPWRRTRSPYRILVSEIMLQQTQVDRVREKYARFVREFPTLRRLSEAGTAEVLTAWKGLGYNRRALALRECARIIVSRHHGRVPRTHEELVRLPGVGSATAGALLAYAFGIPCAFIETNIRRVYLHVFFPRATDVPDSRILPLVEATMDRTNPREWFYALMDYGAMLARENPNPNRRSSQYARQPAFAGSVRELRGRVLAVMLEVRSATVGDIHDALGWEDERLPGVLDRLVAEGFLARSAGRYSFR
jgi:A/G-specific adenine glycosylase